MNIQKFNKKFTSNEECLVWLFEERYRTPKCPKCGRVGKYHLQGKSSHFVCVCGQHQLSPKKDTIFEKSDTDLYKWFYAMYLFSVSKNGVSAKELQRQTKVTYKTAWRMGNQIRKLFSEHGLTLSGEVEVDETFYGKGGNHKMAYKNKKAVLGIVERKGRISAKVLPNRRVENILPVIKDTVARGSHIVTDEYTGYNRLSRSAYGYKHSNVKHGKFHYSWKGQNTNTIEGFWGQFKRSVRGTYHFVSAKHLQSYVDEFAWRYNQRETPSVFEVLMATAVPRV